MKLVVTPLAILALLGGATVAHADQGAAGQPTAAPTASQTTTGQPTPGQTAVQTNTDRTGAADAAGQLSPGQTQGPAAGSPAPGEGSTSATTTGSTSATTTGSTSATTTGSTSTATTSATSEAPAVPPSQGSQAAESTLSSSTAAPATTSGAVGGQEPTGQPATAPGTGPADAGVTAGPAVSNASTQAIWQVQVSGCLAHCQGGDQIQIASQQNTTVQQVAPATPVAAIGTLGTGQAEGRTVTSAGTTPGAVAGSPVTSSITQIQFGCQQACFGNTTIGAAGVTSAAAAIQQLLAGLSLPALSLPFPVAAKEQNTTSQSAYQSQTGQGGATLQAQAATQLDTTQQIVAPAAIPGSDASSRLDSLAVNQTAQGIWQLQVGCIFYCTGTRQEQQASQSNTTIQELVQPPGGGVATTGAVSNSATALIWQVQIGCLFWCYDAIQLQTAASSQSELVVIAGPAAPVTPPPEPSGGTTATGGPQPPSGAQPAGATPGAGGSDSAPAAGAGGSTALSPSPESPSSPGPGSCAPALTCAEIAPPSAPSFVAAPHLPAGPQRPWLLTAPRIAPLPSVARLVPGGGHVDAAVAAGARVEIGGRSLGQRPAPAIVATRVALRRPASRPLVQPASLPGLPSWAQSRLIPSWIAASRDPGRAAGSGRVWLAIPAALGLALIAFVLLVARGGARSAPRSPTGGSR